MTKFILIAIWMVAIIYFFIQIRRSLRNFKSKHNLQNAIDSLKPVRKLTEEEFQAYLDIFANLQSEQYRTELVNRDVSVIVGTGPYEYSSESDTEYFCCYFINNMPFFITRNLIRYINTSDNYRFEIVFTANFGFIISINGYNFLTVNDNDNIDNLLYKKITQYYQPWSNGRATTFRTLTNNEILSVFEQDESLQFAKLQEIIKNKTDYCEILRQRDQTFFEIDRNDNAGVVGSFFLVLTMITLSQYQTNEDLWVIIVATIFAVMSMFFYFHRPKKTVGLDRVNQIKDSIKFNNTTENFIITNSGLRINYPNYWSVFLPQNREVMLEMDVAVGDIIFDDIELEHMGYGFANIRNMKLLSYDHHLSIHKEVEQYGHPKNWSRNALICFVCTIFSIYLFSSTLKDDIAFSYHFLSGQIRTIGDQHLDMEKPHPIKSGDWVMLNRYSLSNQLSHQRSSLQQSQAIALIQKKQLKSSAFIFNIDKRTAQSNFFSLCPSCWQFDSKITQYGRVLNINYDNVDGINQLTIYTDLRYKADKQHTIPIALIQTLCFVFMVTLGVLQLVIIFIKIRGNKRRIQRIVDYYRSLIF